MATKVKPNDPTAADAGVNLDLDACVEIAGKTQHAVAQRADGTVIYEPNETIRELICSALGGAKMGGQGGLDLAEAVRRMELATKIRKHSGGPIVFSATERQTLKDVAGNVLRADAMAQAFGWLVG